jgi:hypothetical protein
MLKVLLKIIRIKIQDEKFLVFIKSDYNIFIKSKDLLQYFTLNIIVNNVKYNFYFWFFCINILILRKNLGGYKNNEADRRS